MPLDASLASVSRVCPGLLPLEGLATVDAFVPVGDARAAATQAVGSHVQVSAGYFAAIGLPLLRGRLLTPDDHAREVAVISDHTARTLWPGQDALGRSFRRGRGDIFQVVGVVADAKIQGFERDPGLVGYVPYGLNTRNGLSLVIRGNAGDDAAIASARRVIKALDPDLPLRRVRTLDSVVDDALAMRTIPGAAAGGVRRGGTAARVPRDLWGAVGDGRRPAR